MDICSTIADCLVKVDDSVMVSSSEMVDTFTTVGCSSCLMVLKKLINFKWSMI
jgi:hypothetical protein